ncbi:MAG: hypothetical protein HQ573_05720 [Desulfobacteraceae bacterium]|nr:hypothetical protein [Desulfobacteraceae bacterium]
MLKYYKIFSVKIFPAIIVIILCLGCRAFEPVERLKESYDPYHGGQYKAALTNWSREARIYRGLDVELIATATFKSSKFRDAYSNEYARAYKLTGSEKTKVLKDQKNAVLAYNDFLLAAYVPDKKLNDFHKKNSIWKIYLTAGKGGLTAPLEIRKIKKVDAVTIHFFPYITPWKSVYLVRFPAISPAAGKALIDGDAENIKLIITSVLGSAEMVWE